MIAFLVAYGVTAILYAIFGSSDILLAYFVGAWAGAFAMFFISLSEVKTSAAPTPAPDSAAAPP